MSSTGMTAALQTGGQPPRGDHAAGSRHGVYVPDNPLSHVLRILRESFRAVTTTLATREGEAFGIGFGSARSPDVIQAFG